MINKKKVCKSIGYVAAGAALWTALDLLTAQVAKAWDYEDFKDDHYKMEALEAQMVVAPHTEDELKQYENAKAELAQVHADHQALQSPIQTLFWGKISNKCPICGE